MLKIENDHIDYSELISKYLSGNADTGEIRSLEEWVKASEINRKQFNAFRKAWMIVGLSHDQKTVDIDKEWRIFKTKVKPEGNQNIRRLETGKKINLRSIARYAAVFLLVFASTFGLYKFLNTDKPTIILTQKSIITDNLPDGSHITLNQYSEISYSLSAKSKTREVALKGEAFFDIRSDANRAFMVRADDITIEVLGTEFYIDARKDQPLITVIVSSGSVSVKSQTDEIKLVDGEVGFYDRNSRNLKKSQNTDSNYLSWKTGTLIFEKSDLESVVFDLNRKFDTNIKIENPEIRSCKITARFTNKSLDAILKIIEQTLNVESVEREGEIILTGQSCN